LRFDFFAAAAAFSCQLPLPFADTPTHYAAAFQRCCHFCADAINERFFATLLFSPIFFISLSPLRQITPDIFAARPAPLIRHFLHAMILFHTPLLSFAILPFR
jgi:hypothetical protein